MSLETVHQKLRSFEKEVTIKKLFLWGFVIAVTSVGIISSINPSYLSHFQTPVLQLTISVLLIFAFMVMYLTFFAGGLASGVMITWFLIKSRDKFYKKNGIVAGNSIATNHEFLFKIAYGLFPFLTSFIRGYNDPKFEELETKFDNGNRNRMENEKFYINQNLGLRRENDELKREVKKLKSELDRTKQDVEELKRKESEREQKIIKNAHANNNTENTKSLDDSNKIEFLDE